MFCRLLLPAAALCCLLAGFKFWRFDIRVVLAEAPGVLNYLVGLVGGQAPISSHRICLPARCVVVLQHLTGGASLQVQRGVGEVAARAFAMHAVGLPASARACKVHGDAVAS
jgi:hypothetical protein